MNGFHDPAWHAPDLFSEAWWILLMTIFGAPFALFVILWVWSRLYWMIMQWRIKNLPKEKQLEFLIRWYFRP